MIRVGLTGTLGAGKSTVGKLFEEWGALRVDADRVAREAVAPGSPALERIRERWGERVLRTDGTLDRAALRRVVAGEPEERRALERMLHPPVLRRVEERLERAEEEGVRCAVVEVPLLFEEGLGDRFDVTVAVDAPRELRYGRVAEERGLPEEEFAALEEAQWPGERKREAADHVIVNDGDRAGLERKARAVWRRIGGPGT